MAQIFEKEWESIEDYDDQLKHLDHYKIHPEMLPYIGRNYPQVKILILGESHYASTEDEKKISDDWYNTPLDKNFNKPWWFNTRHVVNNYLCGRRSKAHSMFRNPAKALIEAWKLEKVNDSEAFTAFAFMNYFQRPADRKGESIQAKSLDNEKAYINLREVVKVIKPQKIIFLSQKAFNAFRALSESDEKLYDVDYIEWTDHPTSKYWNSCNGKEKLKSILGGKPEQLTCIPDGELDYVNVYSKLSQKKERFFMLEAKKKRFWENWIGIKIYAANKRSSVSEIAWYYTEEGRRIGIGYVVKTRLLWIWDYDISRNDFCGVIN